jgi:integrase
MASFRKRGKVWYYRYVDADGVKRTVKGCSDRRATEGMAREDELEAANIRRGLVDAKDLARRDHQARPLSEHFTAYADHLASKGATPKHIELSTGRARRVVAIFLGAKLADIDPPKNTKRSKLAAYETTLTEWVASARLSDVTAERVQKALATLRWEGRSLGTCNHYRTAIKAFAKWCYDTYRTREDALRGVQGFNAKEDRRHDRRTISLEELQRLIAVAERGPAVLGVSGPARALCYRLAVATGLRYSEIASIRPESFNWETPSVRVAACYTKNGRTAVMPLPDDLASDLAAYVAPLNPRLPVFLLPKDKGAELLQADLAVAKIEYQDESGLFFDFHSLRCQTATLADAAGVSPRVVQRLMRHSTLELTGRYTRPRAVDIENAASMLPSLKPSGDRPESMAATGTDGRIGHRQPSDPNRPATEDAGISSPEGQPISKRFGHHLATAGDSSGCFPMLSDAMAEPGGPPPTNEKPLVSKGFEASRCSGILPDSSTGEATRTPDLRIMRPLAA